ncbi:MAG: DMT family transporter [Aurantimonas endophytica]|uniref:DMT family transporter n=1 Tax=Aurantimonas endophytica TaxID=1522175 RepID=UPI003003027D
MRMIRTSQLGLAIGLILLSVFLLSGADAVVKAVSADFPLWQIYIARSLFAVPILLVLLVPDGIGRAPGMLRPWTLLRSLLLTAMWVAYYAALPNMDLSVAATALYTTPLFIAALSAFLTGDRIGWRGMAAIAIGFLGVIVILRPTGADFSAWMLLPILAALFYALAAVVTRMRCADESARVLALSLHGCLLAAGLAGALVAALLPATSANPFLFGPWAPMQGLDWLLMLGLGCAMVVVAIGVARAYQSAPPAIIGTFDYAYLLFAALWGVLAFGERLDALAFLGMGLIIAAGILVLSGPRRAALVAPERTQGA